MESVTHPEPDRSAMKVFLLALLVAAFLLLLHRTELRQRFTEENLQCIAERFGIWAPIAYMALYALSTVLALPGTVMTISGGVLFGKWFGTLWAALGATLGACCAFTLARTLGRDFVARRLAGRGWFQALERGIAEGGLSFVLFVRVVPIIPPTGINFGSGLTSVRFRDYLLGTLIGLLPSTFVYTSVAADAHSLAVAEHFHPSLSLLVGLGAIGMGLLSLLPVLYRRRRATHEE